MGCQETAGSNRKLILYFFSGGMRLRRRIQLKNSLMPEELRKAKAVTSTLTSSSPSPSAMLWTISRNPAMKSRGLN